MVSKKAEKSPSKNKTCTVSDGKGIFYALKFERIIPIIIKKVNIMLCYFVLHWDLFVPIYSPMAVMSSINFSL